MITIVDYGLGNIASIANMLKKIGYKSIITKDEQVIKNASKLILPGVGSFDHGMKNLHEYGLIDILERKVFKEKCPLLGICLGMQLLTQESEEGKYPGLGWIQAKTVKFKSVVQNKEYKIPHMGWNTVDSKNGSILFLGFENVPKFYFVHSYYIYCKNDQDIAGTTRYGIDFVSAVQHENIFGTQFHPEKSHMFGMQLLKSFVENT
jgi:glutamine amidotransferase